MQTIFMAYVSNSMEAVDFYCKAFHAKRQNCFKAKDDDAFYAHAEIVIDDQTVLAVSDVLHDGKNVDIGQNMQFWIKFNDENSLNHAYHLLKEAAQIDHPLSPCDWCCSMADLTDRFGIRWLLTYGA